MADEKPTVSVTIDRRGRVEIRGFKDLAEAKQLARRLGLSMTLPLVRCEGLAPEDLDRIAGRARILGYAVTLVEEGEAPGPEEAPAASDPGENPEAFVRHRRAPWILVAPLVLVGLILLAVPIRDRMYRSYEPMPSIEALLERVESPAPSPGRMRSLIDPNDANYLSFAVGESAQRVGEYLIDQGYCFRLHGAGAVPMTDLVGEGSGVLVLQIDASRSSPNQLFVASILRDGTKSGLGNLFLEVHPVTEAPAPEGYAGGAGIAFDSRRTFEDLERFQAGGRLERTERGLRLDAAGYKAALIEDLSPGLRALLGPGWPREGGTGETVSGIEITFYLDRVELFPWTTDDGPGPRQLYEEIGRFRVAGIRFGDVYVKNTGME